MAWLPAWYVLKLTAFPGKPSAREKIDSLDLNTDCMRFPSYRPWMNALLYQSLWFAAVLGRESWVALPIVLIAVHLLWCGDIKRELTVLGVGTACGVFVDSMLTRAGVFVFSPEPLLLPIPFWLVLIWLGFTATLRHALAWFVAHPVSGVALAGIGAPLSYLAAERMGAVALPMGMLPSGLLIGTLWLVVMWGLCVLTTHVNSQATADST